MRRIIVLCCLVIGFASCKSKKGLGNTAGLKNISVKKIVKNNKATYANFETVSAKIKAKFKSNKTSAGFTVYLRMETDKVIWMSVKKLGFPFAKLKITPDKVLFYEKLKKTYFEGGFSFVSEFLGSPINFDQLQNVLLAKPIVPLKSSQLVREIAQGNYQLSLKKQRELFALFFTIKPESFTLVSQQLKEVNSSNTLRVNYAEFESQFPKKTTIRVLANSKKTYIDLEYKSLKFNKSLTFPFSIPEGYKK